MFSTKALASSLILSIFSLCLVLTPQLASGQATEEDEDPPPFMYIPESNPTDEPTVQRASICRPSFDSNTTTLFCAGEVGVGTSARVGAAANSTMHTFVLDTHETVTLRTRGNLDTVGRLFDSNGRVVATDDNGGNRQNFQITRTLTPGRYYVDIATPGAMSGSAMLHIDRKQLIQGSRPIDLTQDIGNHCAHAAEIATYSVTTSTFERPGDIDVYAIDLTESGNLMIDIQGSAHYELKAADCATSLGLASSSLGATLAPLSEGTYFLYVSQMGASANDYDLNIELR